MKTIGLAAAGVLLGTLFTGVPVQAAPSGLEASPHARDRDEPVRMELTLCHGASDRDCIESIGLVTSDGVIPGAQVSPTFPLVTGPVRIGGSVTGPVGG